MKRIAYSYSDNDMILAYNTRKLRELKAIVVPDNVITVDFKTKEYKKAV